MTHFVITIIAPDSESKKLNSGFVCDPILPRVMPITVANTTSPRILEPGDSTSSGFHSSKGANRQY